MSSDKYLTYVYKIVTKEDKLKLFISSTKEKLPHLLQYFIGNCNSKKTNSLYEWIRPLNKSSLKIKLIKSYPVSSKEEQKKREKYWIRKYKNYGYTVIHNSVKNDKKVDGSKEEKKIYLCLKDVSMSEIIGYFGDKIVSISKEEILERPPPPPFPKTRKPSLQLSKKDLKVSQKEKTSQKSKELVSEGYLGELTKILSRRNSSGLSISQLTNKKTPPKKIKIEKNTDEPYDNILDELKTKIKKIN